MLRDAEAAIKRDDMPAALRLYRSFLSKHRSHPKALQARARAVLVCTRMGEFAQGIELGERAGAAADKEPHLLYAVAQAQFYAGRASDAMATLDRCLRADPSHGGALGRKAVILMNQGDADGAVELLDGARSRGVEAWDLDHVFAQLAPGCGRTGEAIDRLRARAEGGKLNDSARREVCMSLAGLLEKAGEYAEAWSRAGEANAIGGAVWDPRATTTAVDQTIAVYDAAAFDAMRETVEGLERRDGLVFIVGMPRSGTTLIDQILAAHPMCESIGESGCLQRAAVDARIEPAEAGKLARIPAKKRGDAGRALAAAMRAEAGLDETFTVVDKQPFNDQRVGALAAFAHGARVILSRRDPRDIAVSCYFRNFVGGMAWATRMEWIAEVIRQRSRLHTHWLETLPQHAPWVPITEARYETVVTHPEAESKRLVAHAGLEWDDACLRFNERRRLLPTLDPSQAGKGVYTGSVARWERYAAVDPAAFEALHRLAEAQGYSA